MHRRSSLFLILTILLFLVVFSTQPANASPTIANKTEPSLAQNQPTMTIQVSAFRNRHEAENEVQRLQAHGVDGRVSYEAAANKGMWYRVYVGRFDSENQARTYAKKLEKEDLITWSWVKPALSPPAAAQPATPVPTELPTPVTEAAPVLVETKPAPEATAAGNSFTIVQLSQPVDDTINAIPLSTSPTMLAATETESATEEIEQPEEDDAPLMNHRFGLRSQTTLRAFERDTTEGEGNPVLPLYQYLQLDYGDAEEGGWSAHAYGWGRYDLADSAYFEDTADGNILYGYLEYRKPYSDFFVNLGRQHILSGAINDSVDGLQLGAGFREVLSAQVFGGVTARTEETSTDITYGGRLAFHPQPPYILGFSYQYTDLEEDAEQKAAVDVSFNWSHWLTFQGLSSYNLESEGWREHSYAAVLRYSDFSIEPIYQFFSYRDYFGSGEEENNLFNFLKDSDEELTIVGGDIQWQGMAPVRVAARYNHYTYHLRQEDAGYYAGLLSVDTPGGSQIGAEAGRMDGETADNAYSLYRAYFFWNAPFDLRESTFISGDGMYQDYDAPVFDRDNATNYSLSAGMRFFDDALEVKLTGYYSQDPYFDEDIEGVFTLNYQY